MSAKHRVPRTPKYRIHKARNQAYVEFDGRRTYIGPPDDPKSRERYHSMVAEWLAAGRRVPVQAEQITLVEVIAAYVRHAAAYYRDADGKPTSEVHMIKNAVKPLVALYAGIPAVEFSPLKLRAVIRHWIDQGLSRPTINKYVAHAKRLMRYAVSNEMIPPHVLLGIQSVEGLRVGRTEAREPEPVMPVPETAIERVRRYLPRPVVALIDLQLLCGARPTELLMLKPKDIDRSGEVWTATLIRHKMSYKARRRVPYFGPKAQRVLKPFLLRGEDEYLFSPKGAFRENAAKHPTHRRTNQPPTPRRTARRVRDHYTVDTYRRAIARACEKAGIEPWNPSRLRRNCATRVRKEFSLDAAQAVLGHSKAATTEIYAELNQQKAVAIAREIG